MVIGLYILHNIIKQYVCIIVEYVTMVTSMYIIVEYVTMVTTSHNNNVFSLLNKLFNPEKSI